jgi:methionyl-tRNA synthetase
LRDRLGRENVVFVSGTDCYGSPILVSYQKLVEESGFTGSLEDFVRRSHEKQKEALEGYLISLDLFSASGIGDAVEIHREVCAEFFNTLYKNGHLVKRTTMQFYDNEKQAFLNGRQVIGRCPILGCKSDKAYADECELGHQYDPSELIAPKSTLTGNVPEMRGVTNWYFNLPEFRGLLGEWTKRLSEIPGFRKYVVSTIEEFLKPPVVYVKNECRETYEEIKDKLPPHACEIEEKKSSFTLVFQRLPERDEACSLLTKNSVRYRTGKTLVPFRLTGNVEWGVPAPDCEGTSGLTFWVWPESLFAPISFTKAYFKRNDLPEDEWKRWWLDKDAAVYQFIGSDNISFYGPAEVGMWMGMQGKSPQSDPAGGNLQLPYLVANNHILFLDKKASSSGEIKPPMALDLLHYYTPEQLRAHFLGLGLGLKSVSFQPKPLNPQAAPNEADPALKEGNLLTNVFNRVARSCFYTAQSYFESSLPYGEIDRDVLAEAQKTVLDYEKAMCAHEFHTVMTLMDVYIRNINKYWAANSKRAEAENDNDLRRKLLVNTFHMVRTAAVLMHPIAPQGCEMLLEYLGFDESFWDWGRIFETCYDFMADKTAHKLRFLEPRIDFFAKHPSQFN